MSELRPGDKFDEFKILKKIGSGAFSQVFLAHDTVLDRNIVLKQLNPDLSHDDGEWESFYNEAQLTASFRHPGLLTLHSLRVKNDEVMVQVLEYMDSGTLRDILDKDGPLSLESTGSLARQIGNALSYLHRRGIIHRDLKPENILFSQETGWFKLADFGLAYNPNRLDLEDLNGGQPGTLRYMPPEQANDNKISERSDLYTFACVLYEALSAKYYLPIDDHSMSDEQLIEHILNTRQSPLPPLTKNRRLMGRMDGIFQRALAKSPQHRYPNVHRFTRAFTRAVENIEYDVYNRRTRF